MVITNKNIAWHVNNKNQVNKEGMKEVNLNNAQIRATCLHKKRKLVHMQNKRYNIKMRVSQHTQHIHNQSHESNIAKLKAK